MALYISENIKVKELIFSQLIGSFNKIIVLNFGVYRNDSVLYTGFSKEEVIRGFLKMFYRISQKVIKLET